MHKYLYTVVLLLIPGLTNAGTGGGGLSSLPSFITDYQIYAELAAVAFLFISLVLSLVAIVRLKL